MLGIVVNDADQFSVWLTHRRLPIGWRYTGPTGTRAQMHELVTQQFVEGYSGDVHFARVAHQALPSVD